MNPSPCPQGTDSFEAIASKGVMQRYESDSRRLPLWRWCVRGMYVKESDEVIRLQFVCIGRKYYNSAEWLDQFIDNVTAARIAGQRKRYGDKPDARWKRIRELAEADEVLRRARI